MANPTQVIPATGQQAQATTAIKFTEVALVEQSTDNPTHVSFQDRVVQVMAARQSGWRLPGPQEALDSANHALAPFGYGLTVNPNPPFSSYALYHGDQLVQADITRFWPVSVKNGGGDFLFAYETSTGEQWVASRGGLQTWPDTAHDTTPPVYYGNEIAYAATGPGAVNVYAGSGMLYTETNSADVPGNGASSTGGANTGQDSSVRKFITWSSTTGDSAAAAAADHWALEMDHNIILDGQDLVRTQGYKQAFGLFILNGQPLYFFTKDGLTQISYAGKVYPYTYDTVVHLNTGPTAIFNPGGNDNTVWFYALRDGVWYYVEVGK